MLPGATQETREVTRAMGRAQQRRIRPCTHPNPHWVHLALRLVRLAMCLRVRSMHVERKTGAFSKCRLRGLPSHARRPPGPHTESMKSSVQGNIDVLSGVSKNFGSFSGVFWLVGDRTRGSRGLCANGRMCCPTRSSWPRLKMCRTPVRACLYWVIRATELLLGKHCWLDGSNPSLRCGQECLVVPPCRGKLT